MSEFRFDRGKSGRHIVNPDLNVVRQKADISEQLTEFVELCGTYGYGCLFACSTRHDYESRHRDQVIINYLAHNIVEYENHIEDILSS